MDKPTLDFIRSLIKISHFGKRRCLTRQIRRNSSAESRAICPAHSTANTRWSAATRSPVELGRYRQRPDGMTSGFDFRPACVRLERVEERDPIGDQLRRLRKYADLTVSELAEAAGLDVDVVRGIERGGWDIEPEEVIDLAWALGVSPMAILEPDSLLGRLPVAARTNGDRVPTNVDRVSCGTVRRLISLAELHHVLSLHHHNASIPVGIDNAPQREASTTWFGHANDLGEWAAGCLRLADNGNARLADLASAIETHLGVDVMIEAREVNAPLGASITDPEFPFILVNADQPTSRALFTLAHELGHVLNQDRCLLHIDRHLRGSTDSERSANQFAVALLMPESRIREIIDTYGRGAESLAHMLIRFGVSYESLIYRLNNLNIINRRGRDLLKSARWPSLVHALETSDLTRKLLFARGTRPERHPPSLLTNRCWHGVMDGTVGPRPLAGLLDVDVDDLIEGIQSIRSGSTDDMNYDYFLPLDSAKTARSALAADPVAS